MKCADCGHLEVDHKDATRMGGAQCMACPGSDERVWRHEFVPQGVIRDEPPSRGAESVREQIAQEVRMKAERLKLHISEEKWIGMCLAADLIHTPEGNQE